MKREKILFFLEKDRINLYFVKSRKEKVIDVDTTLFFKFGEISDVEKCVEVLSEILSKIQFSSYYLKPDIIVLYDGVSYSDMKFLYKFALKEFGYNSLGFVTFKDVVKKITSLENAIVFNKDYYISEEKNKKYIDEKLIDFKPLIIGKNKTEHLHYSDENLLWKTFKTCFTNVKSCDMIDIGDDK